MLKENKFTVESFSGNSILEHIHEVADFRIKYFKDFPYLYEGNLKYEEDYLRGYAADEKSILVKVHDEAGNLSAVSTALPLITPSDILTDAPKMFSEIGYSPEEFFYYGEIILDYKSRGKGLSRQIFDIQDNYARNYGFSKVAIATVVREENDPRKPSDYLSSDPVWKNLGFEKTPILFEYHWPTIHADGTVKDIQNPMIYWIKSL